MSLDPRRSCTYTYALITHLIATMSNFAVPKTCKAGCVMNPGKDFSVVIEDVPVPEPGILSLRCLMSEPSN